MAGESGGGHGATSGVWVVTAVIMVGTTIGGIALIIWNWPLFSVGIAMIVAGCIGGYLTNIMDMVTEYAPAPAPALEPEQQ
jgi:hypothetical protein